MKKLVRLLIPAFVAVALFASCEDKMDEMVVKEKPTIENSNNKGYIPPKSKIKLPEGYTK